MPLLLIYGREDRGRAAERVEILKQRYPNLNLHIAEGCKHLVRGTRLTCSTNSRCRFSPAARLRTNATSELHADFAVQRIGPAAAQRNRKANQAPQECVFVAALEPREAVFQ